LALANLAQVALTVRIGELVSPPRRVGRPRPASARLMPARLMPAMASSRPFRRLLTALAAAQVMIDEMKCFLGGRDLYTISAIIAKMTEEALKRSYCAPVNFTGGIFSHLGSRDTVPNYNLKRSSLIMFVFMVVTAAEK